MSGSWNKRGRGDSISRQGVGGADYRAFDIFPPTSSHFRCSDFEWRRRRRDGERRERRRGRGRKEERKEWDRSVAMRFLIASQAKRGDAKIQALRYTFPTCSLNESKIAASSTEYKGMESGRRLEREGYNFFFSRTSFSSSGKSQIGKVFNRNLTNSPSIECQ